MAYTKYSAAQAKARALSHGTWKIGYCLNFVWTCLDYPNRAGLASANAAWAAAKKKVYTGTPPAGAPVYWAGGSYGHIAISLGNGYVRSTDWPSKGRVGNVTIKQMTSAWGLKYRGWSKDYAGKDIVGLLPAASYPGTMSVDLKAPITLSNLKYTKKNADVARFEKALWNYLGGPYRQGILSAKAQVGDGYYGTMTQKMCGDAYRKLKWTVATQPGKMLLAKLGFTSVR